MESPLLIPDEKLWPFQKVAIDLAVEYRHFIFCHPTGQGKTVMLLATLERLYKKYGVRYDDAQVLILGGDSAVATWLDKLPEWFGIQPIRIYGPKREAIWKEIEEGKPGFYLCTYDTLWRDILGKPKRQKFHVVLADEIHKARNRKTKRWKGLHATRKAQVKLGASATLSSRGPEDLWGVLNWLDEAQFSSFWAFVQRWCFVFDDPFGKSIGGVKDPAGLRKLLEKYLITESWEVAAPNMPPVRRELVMLDMDKKQRQDYETLEREMMLFEGDELLIAKNSLSKLTYMRQMSVCPQLVLPSLGSGAMISYLVDRIEDDPFTVVFSPYREFAGALANALGQEVWVLRGAMTPEQRKETIARWRKAKGVMHCTIQTAESFDLSGVKTAYFAGFEWDPNLNIQAEGRLKRLDSADFEGVLVQYLMCRGTVDELVKGVVDGKAANVSQFMRPRDIMELVKRNVARRA